MNLQDIGDIQILGAEEELDTPLAAHPTIEVTEDKTRSLTPDFTPMYFSQDSLVASMQERGRPLSVSELRDKRHRPPPRSQTMGDSSRFKKKVGTYISLYHSCSYAMLTHVSCYADSLVEIDQLNYIHIMHTNIGIGIVLIDTTYRQLVPHFFIVLKSPIRIELII